MTRPTSFLSSDAAGKRYRWTFWRDPVAQYWVLRDPQGHTRTLERTWVDSVPRIRGIVDNFAVGMLPPAIS